MTNSDDLVNDIANTIGDAPSPNNLEKGETVRLKIGYLKSNRRDAEGVTISFHFGDGSTETYEKVVDIVESRLDKRKFRVSKDQPRYKQTKSWDVGWVDIDTNGNVVEYEIDNQYLKPSLK